MSRYIESVTVDGRHEYKEEIANMKQCKWMYNEVCCNPDSELCADFPMEGDCRICTHFERENGILGNNFSG